MTPRALSAAAIALLALAIAVRLCLVVMMPREAPTVSHRIESLNDEPAHFNYVKSLAAGRGLPVQTHSAREPGAVARGDFEYWQPPLYHLICAPLVAIAGERTGFVLCRLVSFACGLLTLLVLARVLALLDAPESARRLAVVFVALLPTHAYFSSAVSNDALSWLIAMLLTRELLALMGPAAAPNPVGAHVRTTLLLAAGMLTKSGLAIFYPSFLLAYGFVARRSGRGRDFAVGVLTLLVSALIAAPWYARNVALYGSVFAMERGFGPPDPVQASLAGIYHTIGGTIRFFWFPSSHILALPVVRAIRSWGGVLILLHTIAAVWFVRRHRLDARTGMLALLFALALAMHLRLNWVWGEAEGRFLFPALASIAWFFVRPAHAFFSRFRSGEAMAWAWVTLAALHPWSLLFFASNTSPSF